MNSFGRRSSRVIPALALASVLGMVACNVADGTEQWPGVYPPESQIDRPKGGDAGKPPDAGAVDAGAVDGGAADAAPAVDANGMTVDSGMTGGNGTDAAVDAGGNGMDAASDAGSDGSASDAAPIDANS